MPTVPNISSPDTSGATGTPGAAAAPSPPPAEVDARTSAYNAVAGVTVNSVARAPHDPVAQRLPTRRSDKRVAEIRVRVEASQPLAGDDVRGVIQSAGADQVVVAVGTFSSAAIAIAGKRPDSPRRR